MTTFIASFRLDFERPSAATNEMAEEVIGTKEGLKGCLLTCGLAFLLFILSAAGYLLYIYFLDDSIPSY